MARFELSDKEYERIMVHLPDQRGKAGRPRSDDRQILNAILWVLRTGAPWRDLPERYGSWKTANSRFYRWRDSGVWQRILEGLQAVADADGKVDWSIHHIDGSVTRAHQHAAGAKGGDLRLKRSATAAAASLPRSTSVPKGTANR
jgi:transposase